MLVVEDKPRQLLTLASHQSCGWQAFRITDLAENEAAVAESNCTGDDKRQARHLAGYLPRSASDVLTEQEHTQQDCR